MTTRRTLATATASFFAALIAGTAVMAGLGAASAAGPSTCHVSEPTSAVTDTGNTQTTWVADGNCIGVTIDMVMIDANGETTLSSDHLDEDLTASFTYGVLVGGTSYEFRIHGSTEDTATPVVLTTVTA